MYDFYQSTKFGETTTEFVDVVTVTDCENANGKHSVNDYPDVAMPGEVYLEDTESHERPRDGGTPNEYETTYSHRDGHSKHDDAAGKFENEAHREPYFETPYDSTSIDH